MPRLSDSMEEGSIVRWLKSDGEEVARGDELVEIETDKATITYEADSGGVLQIIASEGATLAVGEVIARLNGASVDGRRASDTEAEEAEPERDAQPQPPEPEAPRPEP